MSLDDDSSASTIPLHEVAPPLPPPHWIRLDGQRWVKAHAPPCELGLPLEAPASFPMVCLPPWQGGFYECEDDEVTTDAVHVLRGIIPPPLITPSLCSLRHTRLSLPLGKQYIVGYTASRGPLDVHRPRVARALKPLARKAWEIQEATNEEGAKWALEQYRPFGREVGFSTAAVNRGVGVARVHDHANTNAGDSVICVLSSGGSCIDFPRVGLRVLQGAGDVVLFSKETWHSTARESDTRVIVAFYTVKRATR